MLQFWGKKGQVSKNYYYYATSFFVIIVMVCVGIIQLNENLSSRYNNVFLKYSTFKQPGNFQQLTSAKLSEYKLCGKDITGELIQGDYMQVRLTTFDINGSPKTSGGDFIYALMQDLDGQFSTAGQVVDNRDGTYIVTFYLAWNGTAEIRVTLVHPSLAVKWLKDVYQPAEKKIAWIARFRKRLIGQTKSEEVFSETSHGRQAVIQPAEKMIAKRAGFRKTLKKSTSCTIVSHRNLSGDNNCIYEHKAALGETVAICRKLPRFACSNLYKLKSNFSYINTRVDSLLTNKMAQLFKKPFTMKNINGWPSTVVIKENNRQNTSGATKDLSGSLGASKRCGANLGVPLVSGYWRGQTWVSFSCNSSHQWDKLKAYNCLRNREVYLFGDSTMRQWIVNLGKLLNLNRKGPGNSYMKINNQVYNFSLVFSFHSWNFYANHKRKYSTYKYEVDIIDRLPRDRCNYVIVVSLLAHFCFWPLKSYLERLTLVRGSLVRLLQDCPNSVIVIKGSHPRNHPFFQANIHSSDWLLYDMNRVMREVFQGIDLIFLDVWDMNLAFPGPKTIHMPDTVIGQEIALFLSHICPDI